MKCYEIGQPQLRTSSEDIENIELGGPGRILTCDQWIMSRSEGSATRANFLLDSIF
jgi:hypothetical protein